MYLGVMIGFLALLIILGLFSGRKNKKNDISEYFVVKRDVGIFFLVGTYAASFLSAGTLIGNTATFYSFGTPYAFHWIGAIGGVFYLGMVLVTKFWRYGYYNNALSMPDLFGERYHPKFSRGIFSIVILVCYVTGIASMLLGINAVWGFISGANIMVIAIISAVIVFFYAVIGGARGVTWTDTLCLSIILVAVLIMIPLVLTKGGGLPNLFAQFAQSPAVDGQSWLSGEALVSTANSYYTFQMTLAWALVFFLGNSAQPHQVTGLILQGMNGRQGLQSGYQSLLSA